MSVHDTALVCTGGHAFDIARQGYVSLLGPRSRTDTGDSADMVAARVDFLGAGHYASVAAAVAIALTETVDPAVGGVRGLVLEIGAGTGYYLGSALDHSSSGRSSSDHSSSGRSVGIAVDSSKFAARRAAAAAGVLSVVADAWSVLPLQSDSVAAVLSVFAPRDPAEITRVLAPGGCLIAVTPTVAHLREIRGKLPMLTIDDGKAERLAGSFAGLLKPVGRQEVSFEMRLTRNDVSALVRMGPTARHLAPEALAAGIAGLDEIETVTGAVTVSMLQKI